LIAVQIISLIEILTVQAVLGQCNEV
jgi:hypothetical protein